MDLFGKSPRPTSKSVEIKQKLAEVIGQKVFEWCNEETPLEDCIITSEKILEQSYNEDGYQLAKYFEDDGFGSDSELVGILDSIWWERDKILNEHIKKWVKEDNIQPQLNIGDKVKYKRRKEEVIAEIARIDKDVAQYLTYIEGIGQIKGKSGHIINFEDCEKI